MQKNFNILNRFCSPLFFLLSLNSMWAQTEYELEYIKFFNKQSLAGKVNSFDTLRRTLKPTCYPLIKNELESIKQHALQDNKTNILNRLQKIDGEMYFLNRNYSKAIPIFTDMLIRNKIATANDSA